MNLWMTFRIAWRALAKNKTRSGLTVLGIVIGTAAVITLVSLAQGAGVMVQAQFESLGTNVLLIFPGSEQGGGARLGAGSTITLTAEDAVAIARECETVLATTPLVGGTGQAIYGNANWAPREILGVGEDYLTVRNWGLSHGGFFTSQEIQSGAKVCVIGRTVADNLFQTVDPIGRTLRIRNIPFMVIGVLDRKGANLVGQDQDNIIVAPYTTIQGRLNRSAFRHVDLILVSAVSTERMEEAMRDIRDLLTERHHIRPGEVPDFAVRNTSEVAAVLGIITIVMTGLMGSIAGISLLVGGVGIMNIMLVSVTERTREIGLRMAVGATSKDIVRQFLTEAMLLSAIGGAVGVALGTAGSLGLAAIVNLFLTGGTRWPAYISWEAVVASLVVSAGVGVFFGWYPAQKAGSLDPIDCLRYE